MISCLLVWIFWICLTVFAKKSGSLKAFFVNLAWHGYTWPWEWIVLYLIVSSLIAALNSRQQLSICFVDVQVWQVTYIGDVLIWVLVLSYHVSSWCWLWSSASGLRLHFNSFFNIYFLKVYDLILFTCIIIISYFVAYTNG